MLPAETRSGIVGSSWASMGGRMVDVVLVLGMHRSGTSAVSGALTMLGGAAPKTSMPADSGNAKGYFESVAFMHFHDELLASAGSSWDDWRAFNPEWRRSPIAAEYRQRAKELFLEEFDGASLAIFKDPRTCRFLPFWLDICDDMGASAHIVMPIRSPLEVAQSLKNRHALPLTKGLLLWLRHCLDAEAHSRTQARSIFAWEAFQSDWRGVCSKIAADTRLSWPRLSDRAAHEIDGFLARDLIHHVTDHAALAAHSDVHEWTLRAYEALLELTRNPFSNSARETLDQLRALLDQASGLFGRVLVDYEIELEALRGQNHALAGERDLMRTGQSEARAEKAALATELAARAEALQRAGAELQSAWQELSVKAAGMSGLASRADRAEKALQVAAVDKVTLSRALATATVELAELRKIFRKTENIQG